MGSGYPSQIENLRMSWGRLPFWLNLEGGYLIASRPIPCGAVHLPPVKSNEDPRQSPAMYIDTIRKLENTAANVEVSINKRAFAAGILLMTYASL